MGVVDFQKQMSNEGWFLFENFVPEHLLSRMRTDTEKSYVRCRNIQIDNGLSDTEGTVHHLVGQRESFMEYLELFNTLDSYTTEYFNGKYILNAFGGNILKKGMSYAGNIHRDIRSFSGTLPLMLNTIVMLDDFTKDNGATWLMHKGQTWADKPTDKEFEDYAFQVTGKAGDVVFFNSNMWHKAGENRTDKPRRSVTPMFTKPFFKQQFDYTQFANKNYNGDSEWLKQVLGYNSRTPRSLEDWYQTKGKRFYLGDQG